MKTRDAMQLKARINNKAKAAKVSPQLMLQNHALPYSQFFSTMAPVPSRSARQSG